MVRTIQEIIHEAFNEVPTITPEKAKEMRDEFGLDGAMIGRASIGNPWFFDQVKHYL